MFYRIIVVFYDYIWQRGISMKKVINLLKSKSVMGVLNCMALSAVVLNAQQCCFWFSHQPEFPAEADRFKKIK